MRMQNMKKNIRIFIRIELDIASIVSKFCISDMVGFLSTTRPTFFCFHGVIRADDFNLVDVYEAIIVAF